MAFAILDRHRAQMRDEGFTVFEDVFSNEEIERLDASLLEFLNGRKTDDRVREVDFGQKVAERKAEVRTFAERPEFLELSTTFIGPDTDLYFNQMVYKNPEGATTFSWHQDDAYGPVEPSPYLTVWIAITDATPENGCISVLPGSYKRGLVEHWESD